MKDPVQVPLSFERRDGEEMLAAASAFRQELEVRRSVRSFSTDLIPEGVVEECLRAAGSAPSGANLQPWSFVVVREPSLKRRIREAAEVEEVGVDLVIVIMIGEEDEIEIATKTTMYFYSTYSFKSAF